MLHAREDYNRFQDPLNKIPMDEPVILFRAQDKYFSKLIRQYADMVEQDNGCVSIIKAIRSHADLADKWPIKKAPDMPANKLASD